MKVSAVKAILTSAIEDLDFFDDEDEIVISSNYGGMDNFVYIDGVSERGFIDLDKIEVQVKDD